MPSRKRLRRERTHEWQKIQQYTLWPEQEVYERLRPVILFGETAAERAKETGASERTLHDQAKRFEQEGMASLFPQERAPSPETSRSLPEDLRQLIVDLKAEYSGFTPHEIATICFLRFERRPSDHTVKRVLAEGPLPSISEPTVRPDGRWISKTPRYCRSARRRVVNHDNSRLLENVPRTGV